MALRPVRCRLPHILRENKLTATEFAEKFGMPKQQVYDYSSFRKVMSLKTAKNVADFFGIPIEELYEYEEE